MDNKRIKEILKKLEKETGIKLSYRSYINHMKKGMEKKDPYKCKGCGNTITTKNWYCWACIRDGK